MQAQLTFSFPFSVSAHDAITAVATHFGATVSINGTAPQVPAHIKQAVEGIGADNPANGVETNPAIAFGNLLNGGVGNAQATPAIVPSSADAGQSQTALAVPPVTSQTSAQESFTPAPGTNAGATVQTQATSAAPTNPASGVEFDSSGLAYDERIHSGNRTKTPGGEWRSKKGVDKSLIKAVELELRAKFPNGANAPAATGGSTSANATGEHVHVGAVAGAVDPTERKALAIQYAHGEALRVAGPQQIDNDTLSRLLRGESATLSPQASEWFNVYYAKRNAAYSEYMNRPLDAAVVPAANVSPQTTGAAVPVAPVVPQIPAASLTAGAGTQTPATNVQPGAELDSTGLPWDARINVGAKIKDAAGVWVQRFDVPGEQKLLIMAELRAALSAPNGAAQPATSQAGAAGSAPAALAPTAQQAGTDFLILLQWIAANQLAGRITATAGPDAAKSMGFADAAGNGALVLSREHSAAWPYIVQILQQQGAV
jgi:hypothetical protein